jgi:hypothetical protein
MDINDMNFLAKKVVLSKVLINSRCPYLSLFIPNNTSGMEPQRSWKKPKNMDKKLIRQDNRIKQEWRIQN